jgi:hypothetical protein
MRRVSDDGGALMSVTNSKQSEKLYCGKVPGNKMLLSTVSICVRPQKAMVKLNSL